MAQQMPRPQTPSLLHQELDTHNTLNIHTHRQTRQELMDNTVPLTRARLRWQCTVHHGMTEAEMVVHIVKTIRGTPTGETLTEEEMDGHTAKIIRNTPTRKAPKAKEMNIHTTTKRHATSRKTPPTRSE